jgi:hypothetical protein
MEEESEEDLEKKEEFYFVQYIHLKVSVNLLAAETFQPNINQSALCP